MNKRKTTRANLENKRKIFLEIGFITVLIFVLMAFEWKSYDQIIRVSIYENNYQMEEDLSPIQLKKKEIVPKKPQSFMVINVVPDDFLNDDLIDIDADSDEGDVNVDWTPIEVDEEPIDEVIPYYSVEHRPEFPGGDKAIFQFIAQNFKIPRIDLELGISGTIYVNFTIDKNGDVVNINIARGIAEASDQEALRVLRMMPRWKPGKQNTRNVAVEFNLPIKVKLM